MPQSLWHKFLLLYMLKIMKKLLVFLLLVGVFGCFDNKAQNATPTYGYNELKPTPTQEKVETFATQFLSYQHYQKFKLDDEFSAKVWESFIKDVDGSHTYFVASDIQSFEKYKNTIDEALLEGNLTAPFEVFNLYRKRYKDRHEKIMTMLDKPFDFTKDESYETDREKANWAKDEAELDEVWGKILKSQVLDLKLSGANDSASIAQLKDRYKRWENRISKWRSDDVFQAFMNAFSETIDPHTIYMIPSNAAQFNIEMSQSVEGIGASLVNDGDYVKIAEIIPAGPLFKNGQANKNDRIVAVAQGENGAWQDIIGWLTDDAVKLIRGTKGTMVRLRLLPGDAPVGSPTKELKLIREKVKLEEAVAKGEVFPLNYNKKEYKIGVIEIPMFYRDFEYARRGADFQSTTKDVKRFLEEFKSKGVDGVVIDLRNNGGGSLTEAITLTGLFINKGPVVQRRDNIGNVDVESDTDAGLVYDGPLAILQNRFSASASEIFAGAIQDYKRGVIVGEQSFGKGTVQQLVDLDQFLLSPPMASNSKKVGNVGFEQKEKYGQLKLTTEKFYRITGNSTQRKGVMPDINLPTPFDPEEMGESSQPSALPYDQIASSMYEKTPIINEKAILKLQEKYNNRLKTDTELKQLNEEMVEYRKIKDITVVSLNEAKRKQERDETEKRRKAVNKLNDKNDKAKTPAEKLLADVLLSESSRIVCDLSATMK
jgi:carboxyl-terminal processing protease